MVREATLEALLRTLRRNIEDDTPRHILIAGPRGSGKTTLVGRVASALRTDPSFREDLLPVRFPEGNDAALSVADFWLDTLLHLAPELHGDETSRVLETHGTLAADWRRLDLEMEARDAVADAAEHLGKHLVVMVEHLLELRDALGRGFQSLLSDLTSLGFTLLATATTPHDGSGDGEARNDKAVAGEEGRVARSEGPKSPVRRWLSATRRRRLTPSAEPLPSFDDWVIYALPPLSAEECRALWKVGTGMDVEAEDIEPVRLLTGGSPGLVSMLARMAQERPARFDLPAAFERLLRDHAEYFHALVAALSRNERRVFFAVLDLWQDSSPGEIAKSARIDIRVVSTMLGRLVDRGVVCYRGERRRRLYRAADRIHCYHRMRHRDRATLCRFLQLLSAMYPIRSRAEVIAAFASEEWPRRFGGRGTGMLARPAPSVALPRFGGRHGADAAATSDAGDARAAFEEMQLTSPWRRVAVRVAFLERFRDSNDPEVQALVAAALRSEVEDWCRNVTGTLTTCRTIVGAGEPESRGGSEGAGRGETGGGNSRPLPDAPREGTAGRASAQSASDARQHGCVYELDVASDHAVGRLTVVSAELPEAALALLKARDHGGTRWGAVAHADALLRAPGLMEELKKLKELWIEGCFVLTAGGIGELTQLRRLRLDGLVGDIPREDVGKLTDLEELAIDGRFATVPAGIGALTSLRRLRLGGLMKELPETIGELGPNLEDLQIEGRLETVPEAIGNLTGLRRLRLGGLMKEIPEAIGQLRGLERLVIVGPPHWTDERDTEAFPKTGTGGRSGTPEGSPERPEGGTPPGQTGEVVEKTGTASRSSMARRGGSQGYPASGGPPQQSDEDNVVRKPRTSGRSSMARSRRSRSRVAELPGAIWQLGRLRELRLEGRFDLASDTIGRLEELRTLGLVTSGRATPVERTEEEEEERRPALPDDIVRLSNLAECDVTATPPSSGAAREWVRRVMENGRDMELRTLGRFYEEAFATDAGDVRSAMGVMVEAVIGLSARGVEAGKILGILKRDPRKADALRPLVIAMQVRAGEEVRAPEEIAAVAEDVTRRIEERERDRETRSESTLEGLEIGGGWLRTLLESAR